MTVEVLIPTMHRNDISFLEKMNIQSDVVIANQADRNDYLETCWNGHRVKMITTTSKGVGKNRNLALEYAKADILLLSDDDCQLTDGYGQKVEEEFAMNPKADLIIFGFELTKNGQVYHSRLNHNKRLHLWNSLKYGTYGLGIRKVAIEKNRLCFSELFGGGCKYGSGEDSLFIIDSFRAGLCVYANNYVLGKTSKDSSTWFTGFNKKYFYDVGALWACGFPKSKLLLKWYFILRMRNTMEIPLKEAARQFDRGMHGYKTLQEYTEE